MAVIPLRDLGKGGVNKDTSPINLPENVFTDALNVRFRNNSIETILGEADAFTMTSLAAEYGYHWRRPDVACNVFAKDGNVVRKTAAGVESSLLTSGSYVDSRWQMDNFGGGYAIIMNNGSSTPLYALYGGGAADTAMQPFPGWNYSAGYSVTAKVIRPFNYSLVAANMTIDDGVAVTNAPSTIRISTQAAVGGFPQVWQPGLTTDTADEFEISTSSPIEDMLELRGSMFIYSSGAIHVLNISNGVASVRPYAKGHGILAQGCVCEFENQHLVVDRNDIYVHNGSGQITPVAEGRMRDYFIQDLNQSYITSVFLFRNARFKEIWICYPDTTAVNSKCNKALIYSYHNDSFTIRSLPGIKSYIHAPKVSGGSFLYGREIVLGLTSTTKVVEFDVGYQMLSGGTYGTYTSMVERKKLSLEDPFGAEVITGIAPIFEVLDVDASVDVHVTSQNVYDKAPNYTNASGRDLWSITPRSEAQGYKVDPRTDGRFLNIKISSTEYWKLSFLGLNVKKTSGR